MSEITEPEPREAEAPPHDEATAPPPHAGWALVLICVAQLMVVLDATIANIALPYIGRDLDIVGTSLTWIVTGYALAFGGLLLLGGRLGDLYGRRRIFMTGLVVFAVASAIGGLATAEWMLLGSRGLQGVGAALASPAALSLITTTFPPGPLRNRAMAMYATMSGVGAAIGLILGGWLTGLDSAFGIEMSGWRLTFLINVPIGLAAAFLAPRFLAESEKHAGELDVPGALTATGGLLAIVYGLTRAGDQSHGWDDTWTIAALVGGAALLAVFALVETRVEHPMLPFRLFANRTRATSFVVMMIMPAAMFAMFFFLSLYIQNVMGFSPLETGFAFLPFSVGMIISAGTVSQLVSRFDARYISGVGSLVAAAALYGFSRLRVDDSADAVLASLASGQHLGDSVNYWTQVLPYVFLMSLGMGAVFVPLMMTALHRIEAHDSGIGSGVLNTMQQVGGALGLAILSTVGAHFSNRHADEIAGPIAQGLGSLPPERLQGMLEAFGAGSVQELIGSVVYLGSFPEGAAKGFLVGAFMMLTGSLVVWTFLNVKHTELQTDHDTEAVHIG